MAKASEASYGKNWIAEIAKLLAVAVVSGSAAFWASTTQYWNRNRELDIRMVDVALTILSGNNDATKSQYARTYALDLLDHYGGVRIPPEQRVAWAASGDLPNGKFPVNLYTRDFSNDFNADFASGKWDAPKTQSNEPTPK